MRDYRHLYAMCKALDMTKEEAVFDFTLGRTKSCRDLSDKEYDDLCKELAKLQRASRRWDPPPGDAQRKKLIGLARSMNWADTPDQILVKLDEFCIKQKKRRMNALSTYELGLIITVMEKIYSEFLGAIKR